MVLTDQEQMEMLAGLEIYLKQGCKPNRCIYIRCLPTYLQVLIAEQSKMLVILETHRGQLDAQLQKDFEEVRREVLTPLQEGHVHILYDRPNRACFITYNWAEFVRLKGEKAVKINTPKAEGLN